MVCSHLNLLYYGCLSCTRSSQFAKYSTSYFLRCFSSRSKEIINIWYSGTRSLLLWIMQNLPFFLSEKAFEVFTLKSLQNTTRLGLFEQWDEELLQHAVSWPISSFITGGITRVWMGQNLLHQALWCSCHCGLLQCQSCI